ncbi:MAG: hypothetical protein KIH63_004755 [Candidatus Saccharibacteria bacterium]|nr:hypothetical protein [Candidatus Saccharibacteria bacterium]
MPIQFTDFTRIPQRQNDYSNIENFFSNILKGYKIAKEPARMDDEQRKMQLANRLSELQNQYYAPKAEADIAHQNLVNQYYPQLTEAQIQHYKDQAAGRTFAPSGLGKLVQERADLAAKDPNSPLIAEYDRVIKAQGGSRFAPSGLGKLYTERQQAEEGYLPGSNGEIPLTPEEQAQLLNRYDLQIQKQSTDSATRTTALRGQNLLKSIDSSNLDALTRYSGLKGGAKLASEKAKDLMGKPSEEYLQYLEALQAVQLEAKELRQFFGDSITPDAANAIYEMVNATSLTKSPEAAKRMIQKSRDTIKKQIDTFTQALKNPQAYNSGSQAAQLGPQDFSKIISQQANVTQDNPLGLSKRKKD